jgi:hypothetical protein
MLHHYSGRRRAYRRLGRRVISLLLFTTWPAVALAQEPTFIEKGIDHARQLFGDGSGQSKNGFYPEFSNMNAGSGFISVGPGYRHTLFDGNAFVDLSAAASWHFYKMAQGRLEFPALADGHLTVGTQTMYQDNTQVNYYGIGDDIDVDNQTQYRLKTFDVSGYARVRPREWFTVGTELGWLQSPHLDSSGGTFNGNFPDSRVVFPTDPAMSLADQPRFIRSELSAMVDTINAHSRPTSGSLYRGAVTSYSDRSSGAFDFTQYEGEGLQMVPLGGKRVILALHAWTMHTGQDNADQTPFYLMPSIGGHNTLRAYHSYQFHDLNTVVANAEVRYALFDHVDLAAIFDAGSVAPRYSDLNFGRTSIGAGVRVHTERVTIGRMDVAHGSAGWNVIFRTSDPFKLSRVTRRLATIPFAP